MKAAFKSFDFVLDTVASNSDLNPYLATLKTNGVYSNVGLPAKPWKVNSFSLAVGNKLLPGREPEVTNKPRMSPLEFRANFN
ncbi:hypothetical protein [Mucilaginibacter sp. KACC 22063]|uniref:hypothetical protein n=1 Tax=Mucilaginibacter sp. KACC 22063 TaxID=3025666 RepID=UPI0023650501|nr:hypothetical protein [Mucilaginibacter sp. KACC 22063]WDF57220.1 hypothetical protein PQ461_09155 [Mucilaginibacter sp. KACC 22063]